MFGGRSSPKFLRPSRRMLEQNKTANCVDSNCYRLEYSFNIISLDGSTHTAECYWDVDATRKLATPLNGYARYYFTPRKKSHARNDDAPAKNTTAKPKKVVIN